MPSGPKPYLPRLQDLDPEDIATHICARLVQHAFHVTSWLEPRVDVKVAWGNAPPESFVRAVPMTAAVRKLTRWAQTGEGEPAEVREIFEGLYVQLFAFPFSGDSHRMPPLDAIDIDVVDEVSTMLAAAAARLNLRLGQEMSTQGLAVLAGISYNRVRHLGVQRCRPGRVTAEEARRFLEARDAAI